MNRRERVIRAVHHEETDYVPYNFHATAQVYERVRSHYGLSDNNSVVEFIGNHIVKIGSDFNVNPWAKGAHMQLMPSGGPVHIASDVTGELHADEFGCVWDRRGGMPHPVSYPLADNPGDLDSYEMPDPCRKGRFDAAKALAAQHCSKVFVFGKLGMALFERAWSIRGFEQLLSDLALRPEFVEELLDRILYEWNLPIIEQQLAIGVDGFYFADDWGSKTSMLFSPQMWRRFIKPRLAVCYQLVKKAGVFVGQHSDGNILEILPDLIEIGLDIFNPVQPSVYDPYEVKKRHGAQITLYGGIDVETTLPFGKPNEVRAEILERAKRLGSGGGYVLQSSHTIMKDVPLENIIAYIETCHELAGIDTHEAFIQARGAKSSPKKHLA
jgi:uroporphyrinogen decarboxylase